MCCCGMKARMTLLPTSAMWSTSAGFIVKVCIWISCGWNTDAGCMVIILLHGRE